MKDHPVSFSLARMNISPAEVEAHIVQAQSLRSAELARLSRSLFRAPAALLRRLGATRSDARTARHA